MMPNTIIRCAAATLSLLALAGCDQIDPLTRPYMWHPDNAVAHNMAAMAVNPADLVHGRETGPHRVRVESEGVERVWTGKTLPLLGGAATSVSTAPAGGGS
jgi:hypothetical protein